MKKSCLIFLASVVLGFTASLSQAVTYEVGPGKPYANIGDVPLEDIAPGDTVLIYYRDTPYKEKWVIVAPATQSNPVVFRGVPGPGGELPVIDGQDAVTRTQLNFWGEERSIIKIGGSNVPYCGADSPDPSYIIVENLEIKNILPSYTFTGRNGLTSYVETGSPVWVERGNRITIRNCILHTSANGFSTSSGSKEITLEGCYLHDNGMENNIYRHSIYTESHGIYFQYNRLGPLRASCTGNNLKDRSCGLVARYNWIEAGARQLDLVDSDYADIRSDPRYGHDHVYGNVLYETWDDIQRQMVHFGGDSGVADNYRMGPLQFYNNTVVSKRTGQTSLFRPQTDQQTVDCFNNIGYVTAAGTYFHVRESNGTVNISHNWFKTGYVGGTGVVDDGTNITGSAPGFVDFANEDFQIAAGSPCIDQGKDLPASLLPDYDVIYQYVKHQGCQSRPSDHVLDIGAYEYDSAHPLEVLTTTLPDGYRAVAYSALLRAIGGVKPYAWSVISGSLPGGLTLDAGTGLISGTPTQYGTFYFTVQAADSAEPSDTAAQALSLTIILLPVDIETTGIRDWWTGAHYSQVLSAGGGDPPYAWSVDSGSLPDGLSLNSSTGEISGVPTAAGTYGFTIKVEDSQVPTPDSDTRGFTVKIDAATGTTYFVSAGGSDSNAGTYESPWGTIQHAVDSVSAGGAVVVLDGAYAGFRIGTSGTANAPIKIVSNNIGGATINALGSGCAAANVEVIANTPPDGVSCVEIDGFVDANSSGDGLDIDYGSHVTVKNCTVSSSMATGIILQYSNYCLIEKNESHSNANSGICLGWDGDNNVVRDNVSRNNGSNGVNVLQAGGNTQGCTGFRIERNRLYGNGAGLSADGLENSVISNNLIFNNTTRPSKLSGQDAAFTSRNNRMLNNTMIAPSSNYYDVFIHRYTATIPAGTDNKLFNNILYHYSTVTNRGSICIDTTAETGFESNYNVVMEYFALDDNATTMNFATWKARGHDLNSVQATAAALFTNPDAYDYTLKAGSPAIDAGTMLDDVPSDLVWNTRPMGATHDIGCYEFAGTPYALDIRTTSLPGAKIQQPYSETVYALGGKWPYAWSIVSGSLPTGLSLDPSSGQISGTPTVKGTFDFTIEVEDSQVPAATDTQDLSIQVTVDPLDITTASLPGGYVNVSYSQTLQATGGITPYTWSIVSGGLPAGLSLNSSTGVISGVPAAAETANFTVQVSDSDSPVVTDTQALSITIDTLAPLDITTTTLPDAVVNQPYSQTLQAAGGWQPYSWSVASGNLPDGLSLNPSTGVVSGTVTTTGTWNFTVQVTDSQYVPASDTQALSITAVLNPLVITTTSLPDAYLNQAYSQTLEAAGGQPPITWSISAGSLPDGLSLNPSTGVVSGTPTALGTSSFTVQATDSQTPTPATDTQDLSITVNIQAATDTYALITSNGPSKTNSTSWVTKTTLQFTPSVTDAWVILAFAEVNGDNVGVNTRARLVVDGTSYADLTHRPKDATDWFPFVTSKVFANLSAAAHTVSMEYTTQTDTGYTTLRNARILAIRKQNLTMHYAVAYDGTTLQALTDTFQTYVSTSFTPSAPGSYLLIFNAEHRATATYSNFIRARLDSATLDEVQLRMRRADDLYTWASFKVVSLDQTSHTVSIEAAKEPDTAAHYIRRCRVTAIRLDDRFANGVGESSDAASYTTQTSFQQKLTRTWTASPAGNWLMMVSGNVQASDTNYSVEAQAQLNDSTTLTFQAREPHYAPDWMDFTGFDIANLPATGQTVDIDYRSELDTVTAGINYVHFAAIPLDTGGPAPLTITTTSLPCGQIGAAYDHALQATGGTAPYTWSVDAGSLPDGLTLSSGGVISGTPTAAGTSNFTVKVTDSQTPTPATDDQALSITIPADLAVTTASLPDGQIGVAYSQALSASGGVTPYTWSLDSGALPNGLTLSSGGLISGTPTTAGTSNFTIQVADSQAPADTATKALSIYIPADLIVTTSTLPDGQIGVAYNATLVATGGVTPFTWSLDSGTLPSGLTLSSGGIVSGTPTAAGTSNFTVKVTDSQSPADTATKALSIYIPADLVVTTSSLPDGQIGVAYSQALSASGGVTPYAWSLDSGSLPNGLSLSSGGLISGTPTTAGTSNFTVKVTDSQSPADTATKPLSITVTGGVNSTYEFAANDSEVSTTSTSWQTRTSLAFTPPVADTWLILGFAEYKGSSTSYSTLVRMTVDAAVQAETTVEPKDATDYQSFMTMKAVALSAAAHTINIDYCSESASATARIRSARIVAIRKSALEVAEASADSAVALTTAMTDYVTVGWTPSSAGDYLVIWSAEVSANTSYSTEVQAKYNSGKLDGCLVESKDNSDYWTFESFAVVSCGASQQTAAVAAAKETGSTAVHNIRRCRLAAIRLTGGRFGGFAASSSDGESTTTSTSFQEKLTKSWSPAAAGNWVMFTSFELSGTSTSYSTEARVQLDDVTTMAQPLKEPKDATDFVSCGSVDVRSLAAGTRRLDIDYRTENANATAAVKYVHMVALPLE